MSATPPSSNYGSGMAAIDALRRMQPPAKGATPVTEESTAAYYPSHHVSATMIVCLASCIMGAAVGYASLAIPELSGETAIEIIPYSSEARWFVAMLPLAAVPGALASCLMMNHLGPRRTMMVSGWGFVCSWFMMMLCTDTMTLFMGRIIGGFYSGVVSVCVPLYVTEISPACRRAMLAGIIQVAVGLGILLPYVLFPFLRWRLVAAACTVPPVIFVVIVHRLRDTPQWLLSKGIRVDADRAVIHFYGTDFLAEFEFRKFEMENVIPYESKYKTHTRVGLCLSLQLLQHSSFANVIFFNATQILKTATPDVPTDICAALMVASHPGITLIFSVLTADIGRRPLLVLSTVLVTAGLVAFRSMETLRCAFNEQQVQAEGSWPAAFAIFFVVIGHSLGLGTLLLPTTLPHPMVVDMRDNASAYSRCGYLIRCGRLLVFLFCAPVLHETNSRCLRVSGRGMDIRHRPTHPGRRRRLHDSRN
ncbi:facilitated trehalose transporter Tret1-like isoform X2 [Ornithodoros turicata]|uniref:facilitated trehalose transporter Tret1-like isoform X2 n=1 Tax=Ornithodoros turicata TaxID=34597 RepID=UPI003139EC6E